MFRHIPAIEINGGQARRQRHGETLLLERSRNLHLRPEQCEPLPSLALIFGDVELAKLLVESRATIINQGDNYPGSISAAVKADRMTDVRIL